MIRHNLVLSCLSVLAIWSSDVLAADPAWIGAWSYVPLAIGAAAAPGAPKPALSFVLPRPDAKPDVRGVRGPDTLSNATLHQLVRVTAAGERIQLRFGNEFGSAPLTLGKVVVAYVGEDGAVGTSKTVAFDGQPEVTLPVNASMLTDAIDLPVAALQTLVVNIYLPKTTILPGHLLMQTVSQGGDFTQAQHLGPSPARMGALVTGVFVAEHKPHEVIVALGDSITEGTGATPGKFKTWPDQLADELAGRAAVLNAGIGGNRVLNRGTGESALARFDRDVLSAPGVASVIVLEGINDIVRQFQPQYGERANADDLISGYKQIIMRAHEHGLKVYIGTILPFGNAKAYSDQGEAIRVAINTWIRRVQGFDGMIDFEAVTRDPANPNHLRADFQSGDWLHPSDAGYAAMARAALQVLRPTKSSARE